MLKSAKITACDTNNGGYGFGIYAGGFGKLTIGTWKVSPSNVPFNMGDFWVDWLI